MSKTLQERFIEALIKRGNTIVPSKSRKYTVVTRNHKPGTFYFVGKSGAVRIGRASTKSVPVGPKFKAQLLVETEE